MGIPHGQAGAATGGPDSPPLTASAATGATDAAQLGVTGHGWGHGRGMGQWGALGYALGGMPAPDILQLFYSNTTPGTIPVDSVMTVRLSAQAGLPTTVIQQTGALLTSADDALPGGRVPHPGLKVELVSAGMFQVSDGSSCAGPWTPRPALVAAAQITLSPTVTSDDSADMVGLCQASSTTRWFRGDVIAVDAGATQATVSRLPNEAYLGEVINLEMSPGWADLGAGKGAEALKAQAVAARSYSWADNRWTFAKTCDDVCQSYTGKAVQVGSSYRELEDARTNRAVADTAGQIRLLSGSTAHTEFSASTGGWTAGGTFPAVEDTGDAYASNPNHNWSTTIPFPSIEARYAKGSLRSAGVLTRNGLGADGGRVLTMRLSFTGGTVDLTGDQFRIAFGLKSNWFSLQTLSPTDTASTPTGGYSLASDGTLVPFGAAPAPTGASTVVGGNLARAVALGGSGSGGNAAGGFVLDGWGFLHAFNGAPDTSPGTSWTGWDIARDAVVRRDGRSGYVLDGWGGIHPFGGAPFPSPPGPYLEGQDVFRRLVLRGDGTSGYSLTRTGSVGAFGGALAVTSPTLGGGRTAVGLFLRPDGASGYVMDDAGALLAFAPPGGPVPPPISNTLTGAAGVDGRADGFGGYAVSTGGAIDAFGNVTPAIGATGGATRKDIALIPQPSGYVLDGWGAIHSYGGAPAAHPSTSWAGWDIARRIVTRADGAGYVLDGWGGVHPFGTDLVPTPPTPVATGYWPGRDVAKDLVLLPGGGGGSGYVLDAFGGLFPFGGAPAARTTASWPGWNIARTLVINPAGTGGYVLDGWGGLHPFAVGSAAMPPALVGAAYWSGWDIARDVTLTGPTSGYTLDGWGGLHPFGGAGGGGTWYWSGHDLAIGLVTTGGPASGVAYLDQWGGVHAGSPAPTTSPAIDTTATWPGWSIARDLT